MSGLRCPDVRYEVGPLIPRTSMPDLRLLALGDLQEGLEPPLLAPGALLRGRALLGLVEAPARRPRGARAARRRRARRARSPRRPAPVPGWRTPPASPRPGRNARVSPSETCRRSSAGTRRATIGTCLARIPTSPTAVRVESCTSSPLKTSPSGVRTWASSLSRSATVRSAVLAVASEPSPSSRRPRSRRPRAAPLPLPRPSLRARPRPPGRSCPSCRRRPRTARRACRRGSRGTREPSPRPARRRRGAR